MKSVSGRCLFVLASVTVAHLTAAADHAIESVIGGAEMDKGVFIKAMGDGGFVIVGVTKSQGAGGEDVYLVRLDAEAHVEWERAIGGAGDDDGWAVSETEDGGFVIVGFTNSQGAGGLDCSLVATDSNGFPVWSKTYGGDQDDRCWALAATADGGWVLAGETASSGAGKRDCFLVKTDANGQQLWSETYGGEQDDRCFSVVSSPDGGFVVAGQTFSYGKGDRDAWILKTDSKGSLEWSKTHGGEASDVAHSVVADGRGSYLITGYTTSLATTPDDPMILKISNDGKILFSSVLEMDGHNRSITGALAPDGGLCLAGLSVAGSPRTGAALIAKVDSKGHLLWSKTVLPTTRGQSFGYGVTATRDGGCAITGHTTEGSAGDLDILFAITNSKGR